MYAVVVTQNHAMKNYTHLFLNLFLNFTPSIDTFKKVPIGTRMFTMGNGNCLPYE